jgi:hypothetical protein
MNYYFTGILIILMLLLAIFVKPAHARNEYLNNGTNECRYGDIDLSISKRESDHDYRTYDTSDYDNNSQELRLSFRKYLGISKKHCDEQNRIRTKNETLKQQIELYKVCKGINTKQNLPNFKDLLDYCEGIKATNNTPRYNPYKSMIEKIK